MIVKRLFVAAAAFALLTSATSPLAAKAPCRGSTGKFIKCSDAKPKVERCRNAKGQFAKCGNPGAKPA